MARECTHLESTAPRNETRVISVDSIIVTVGWSLVYVEKVAFSFNRNCLAQREEAFSFEKNSSTLVHAPCQMHSIGKVANVPFPLPVTVFIEPVRIMYTKK